MKRFLAVFLLLLAVGAYIQAEVQAQALQLVKPFTGKINKAVASTIGKRLNTMGFAVNDPIYGATMAASEVVLGGAVAAGSVAATVAAVGSAPVWLSVALAIGAAYEIYDWSMGSSDWKATPNSTPVVNVTTGTVVKSQPLPAPSPPDALSTGMLGPMPVDYADPGIGGKIQYPSDLPLCASFTAGTKSGTVCGNTSSDLREQVNTVFLSQVLAKNYTYLFQGFYVRSGGVDKGPLTYSRTYTVIDFVLVSQSGPTKGACTMNSLTCPDGIMYSFIESYTYKTRPSFSIITYGGTCNPCVPDIVDVSYSQHMQYNIFNNPSWIDPTKKYSINDAAAKLSDTDLNSLADPELIAAVANKLWQQAAQQPGYEGAPYDINNSITAADILADVAVGLYPHPTIYDLLSLPSPNVTTAPQLDPEAIPVPGTAPDSGVTVDLGPDPNHAPPVLEDAPTGAAIVNHVMGLLPGLSSFTVPPRCIETGGQCQCIAPQIELFGNVYSMQSMCDLLEQQRILLSTIFSALWGIFALTIVLRA